MEVEREILDVLKRKGYTFGVTLPCRNIKDLIGLIDSEPNVKLLPVTREEEGVGICSGAYLAGKRSFMLIQSSGLGNSFNALASLSKTYKIPILILASYRGYYNEMIPAQIPFGQALPKMLDALEIPFRTIEKRTQLSELGRDCDYSLENETPYVILLSPELFEDV